ncbi:MAG: response regulator [Anaerolineae bacterium]|nr:response regulator [Anaerolineae bacterium]
MSEPSPNQNADCEGNILLVDDDSALLEAVTDLLEVNNFHVVTAIDGKTALEIMRDYTPDLIISDITMPIMDGYQFFDTVRQNSAWTPIPFIFLTARGQQMDVRTGYSLGADDYLVKPFEPEDLIIKVQARLKRVRAIQAATQTEVDHMKQQLIAIFSHELRTPLTCIYGYANILHEDHAVMDDRTMTQMLDEVADGAERLVRLVENLMLLVRIDSGVVGMEVVRYGTDVDLSGLLKRVVESFQPVADMRKVVLDLQIEGEPITRGMKHYLENIMKNLVDNGIKFCKRGGGLVRITLNTHKNQAVLTVSDDGIGIAPTNQARIFDRFEQIDRHEMEQQGVGLGLTLAKSLIEYHSGSIEVSSEPGKGSIFTVRLPLA